MPEAVVQGAELLRSPSVNPSQETQFRYAGRIRLLVLQPETTMVLFPESAARITRIKTLWVNGLSAHLIDNQNC